MRKRLGVVGAIIALGALTVGAVTPASGSSDRGSRSAASADVEEQTIHVVFLPRDFAEIDNGEPGVSLGDDVVFSGVLRQDGARVGRLSVVCTFVFATAEREEAQCPGTAVLPGGQIAASGVIVNRSLTFTIPITGGSGEFEGAEGQLISQDASSEGKIKLLLTIHLDG